MRITPERNHQLQGFIARSMALAPGTVVHLAPAEVLGLLQDNEQLRTTLDGSLAALKEITERTGSVGSMSSQPTLCDAVISVEVLARTALIKAEQP